MEITILTNSVGAQPIVQVKSTSDTPEDVAEAYKK